jgi:threonine dehydratase
MHSDAIDQETIAATERLIRPYIRRTPVIEVDGADFGLDAVRLSFKLELLQHAGVFKTRGAFANLLLRDIPGTGVAAASGGNHGAAVAYAAAKLGILARIFVPNISSPAKIGRIREYGAQLVVVGERYDDALAASRAWVAQSGALAIHAFDQRETLLGQGTIGLEFEQQVGDLDTLLVAVGGGGLIAGIASWYSGRIRVVGVEPEAAPTLTKALLAGRPVDAEAGGIAVDSLAPRRVGELVFPIVQHLVERVVLVSDDAIRHAQKALWGRLRVVAEPGGAAPLAALLSGRYEPRAGEHVGVLLSGGNTVAVDFDR